MRFAYRSYIPQRRIESDVAQRTVRISRNCVSSRAVDRENCVIDACLREDREVYLSANSMPSEVRQETRRNSVVAARDPKFGLCKFPELLDGRDTWGLWSKSVNPGGLSSA